jgi:hypothetical protein
LEPSQDIWNAPPQAGSATQAQGLTMPRLSFSIRDVFWLTLVVGLGVGWWVDRGQLVEDATILVIAGLQHGIADDDFVRLQEKYLPSYYSHGIPPKRPTRLDHD